MTGETIILEGIYGSQAYGTARPDSDVDRMAVYLSPLTTLWSLAPGKDSRTFEDAEGDMTLHEVKKFINLCGKGNPTILELLFCQKHTAIHPVGGEAILALRQRLVDPRSMTAAHLGFAADQFKLHERRKAAVLSGAETDPAHDLAWANKPARHAIRLLRQVQRFLQGDFSLLVNEATLEMMDGYTKLGEHSKLAIRDILEKDIRFLEEECAIPFSYDPDIANGLLIEIRRQQYEMEMT